MNSLGQSLNLLKPPFPHREKEPSNIGTGLFPNEVLVQYLLNSSGHHISLLISACVYVWRVKENMNTALHISFTYKMYIFNFVNPFEPISHFVQC